MRFGLVALGDKQAGPPKRLTFEERGLTNNACVRIDGNEWIFGERPFRLAGGAYAGDWPGQWLERDGTPDRKIHQGRRSTWAYANERIQISQTVGLVPGPQSGQLDTCLVLSGQVPEAAARVQCADNLGQIGLGAHNRHDTLKTFPPGATRNRSALSRPGRKRERRSVRRSRFRPGRGVTATT